jgi:hypothetical protein
MYKVWFEILRFYLRVALWGDPVEPKATPRQLPEAKPLARLKPVTQAE